MGDLRIYLSVILFFVSCYLAFDLFTSGFNFNVFLACFLGFIAAHFIWPKDRKKDGESGILDWAELLVDLPFRALSSVLRGIGRAGKDVNPDIDI